MTSASEGKNETTTSSELSKSPLKWSASTSNEEGAPEEDAPAGEPASSMLGFSSFLIAIKSVTLVIYLVLLIVSGILFDNAFFITIIAFGVAEFVLIGITVFHGFRPTLSVVFCMLGFEMALSLVKLIFALVLMSYDGGKDCVKDPCSILKVTEGERFYLFFFILFTAFADGLIALLTIANSPQMHEFEIGDKYLF